MTSPIPAEMNQTELSGESPAFSKRAARRLIQRAFVLAGRDKYLRQHIREARVTTLWTLEDWNLAWTVIINRGRLEFARRPAKQPDLTFTWRTAAEFFSQAEGAYEIEGTPTVRRFAETVVKGFFAALQHVLRNPVDDAGESLL